MRYIEYTKRLLNDKLTVDNSEKDYDKPARTHINESFAKKFSVKIP